MTSDRRSEMTAPERKVYENRLRRAAARQGLRLVKSRTRDPRALTYGVYWLADANNVLVTGEPGRGIADIAKWLGDA